MIKEKYDDLGILQLFQNNNVLSMQKKMDPINMEKIANRIHIYIFFIVYPIYLKNKKQFCLY